MQDSKKIKDLLDYLNSLEGPGKGSWIPARGYHSIQATEVKNHTLSIIHNSAMPLKAFVNTTTGEVKTYLLAFLDDEFETMPKGSTSTLDPESDKKE